MTIILCLLLITYLYYGGRFFLRHKESHLPPLFILLLFGLYLIGLLWMVVLLTWIRLAGFVY